MDDLFLSMIRRLRETGNVLLYRLLLDSTAAEEQNVLHYLGEAYQAEALEWPGAVPPFQPVAALWAARTVYVAAQLMLFREHGEGELEGLLPPLEPMDAASMLSADLTLRYLPDLIRELGNIHPEDRLIPVLEAHAGQWHFSSVRMKLEPGSLDFRIVRSDETLYRAYLDRIIRYRRLPLALHPAFQQGVRAALGLYAAHYWKEFDHAIASDHVSERTTE